MPVGAVDTNVRRVLARVVAGSRHALPAVPSSRRGRVRAAVPRAADWTHALMDVGATVCRGSKPACQRCPARRSAATATAGSMEVARATASPEPAFPSTSRWLRGRILDVLRDGIGWVEVGVPIGQHERPAIEAALADLAADGLIERAATGACGLACRSRPPPRRGRLGRRCRPPLDPSRRGLDLPRRAAAARRRPDAVRARPARSANAGPDGRATADDGRGDGRRRPARPGTRGSRRAAHGTGRDGDRRGRPGPRGRYGALGPRPDRDPRRTSNGGDGFVAARHRPGPARTSSWRS